MEIDAIQGTESVPNFVVPVPRSSVDNPFIYKNLAHATNSCYIAATISASFASWDAWDGLLEAPSNSTSKNTEILRKALRKVVNEIRLGNMASPKDVDNLRRAMVLLGFPSGEQQEDATHFFSVLLESLGAPLVPLHEELLHNGIRDRNDERLIAERFIWLTFGDCGSQEVNFHMLLKAVFFGEIREGLKRRSANGQSSVNAECHRLVLPEYTPGTPDGPGHSCNSFNSLSLPMALKRYGDDLCKIRTPVILPLTYDFSGFVIPSGSDHCYALHLKSVVCHLGSRLGDGHYVSFTYDASGWRRWDDLGASTVELSVAGMDGLPINSTWKNEMQCDSYIVFYELVSCYENWYLVNDENVAKLEQSKADAEFAKSLLNEDLIRQEVMKDAQTTEREDIAAAGQDKQIKADEEFAKSIEQLQNLEVTRNIQVKDDEQYAKELNEAQIREHNRKFSKTEKRKED